MRKFGRYATFYWNPNFFLSALQLEEYFKTRTEIDDKTLSYISSYFKIKKIKRNEFLLKEGEICNISIL